MVYLHFLQMGDNFCTSLANVSFTNKDVYSIFIYKKIPFVKSLLEEQILFFRSSPMRGQ